MAKKTVASLHDGSKEGRAYTKVIKMVKSPKTGAYIFDEQMVPNEKVQDFFKKELKCSCCKALITYKAPLADISAGGFFLLLNRFGFYYLLILLYLCGIMYCTKK